MTAEELKEIHEVDRKLMDNFKEKPYIYKEILRMVNTEEKDIKEKKMNSIVGRFPFLG